MNCVVHKFTLEAIAQQSLPLPEGAQLLTAQLQHGKLQLWALVDPDKLHHLVQFHLVGTGHPEVDPQWHYLGTVQLHGGSLVLHIFVERSPWLSD